MMLSSTTNKVSALIDNPNVFYMLGQKITTQAQAELMKNVKNAIEKATNDVVKFLKKTSKKISTEDEIKQVATISAESKDLGAIIAETISKVGAEPIMIVRDAVGYSALLGLSWPNMYMTDSARLMGLERIQERTKVADPEVYAKFREAMVGICNGFLIAGGYDPAIGLAMMREEKMLSASFKGREIIWSDNAKGTWVVDGSTERITAHFTSAMAEELGLSDGTVSDDDATMIEDLMYQRGIRSFVRMPQDGEVLVREYIEGWRKGLADCAKSYPQYQEAMGDAQGKDEKKNLTKAKGILEKVLSIINKYPAVAIKLNQEFGLSKLEVETELLKLQERIRGLGKSTSPPPSGGGKRGGGGGMGPGSSLSST